MSYFFLLVYTIQMAANHFTAYSEKMSPAHPQHLQAKYINYIIQKCNFNNYC